MNAPERLRIGGQVWTVRRRSLADDYGQCTPRLLRITLAAGQVEGQLRDTLMHELLHACWSATGLDQEDEQQETIVRSLAPWLLLALRDNPELVAFLTSE